MKTILGQTFRDLILTGILMETINCGRGFAFHLLWESLTERDETIKALFSPLLWTEMNTDRVGKQNILDRSTLYAFRGLFVGEATDKAMPYFNYYSSHRLLGDHVPYPVEAWPEGNQRHLSAKVVCIAVRLLRDCSGFTPNGFSKFKITHGYPRVGTI